MKKFFRVFLLLFYIIGLFAASHAIGDSVAWSFQQILMVICWAGLLLFYSGLIAIWNGGGIVSEKSLVTGDFYQVLDILSLPGMGNTSIPALLLRDRKVRVFLCSYQPEEKLAAGAWYQFREDELGHKELRPFARDDSEILTVSRMLERGQRPAWL